MSFRCGVCSTDTSTSVRTCTYQTTTWRLFYANCPKLNQLCSAKRGAYVPAITVCTQRLFT